MQIQNIGFTGNTNTKSTKYKYKKINNSTFYIPNQESKLKKTLVVLGALAAAGIGIGVFVKNKSTKPIQEAVNTAVQKNSDVIQKTEINPKSADTLADSALSKAAGKSLDKAVQETQKVESDIARNPKTIKTLSEAKAEFQERVAKAKIEYESRLDDKTGFLERIKKVQGADNPKNKDAKSSKIRIVQLKTLAKEQFTALDDKTIDRLVYSNNSSAKLKNMKSLKSLSPEQLIKAQADEQGRNILFDMLENETSGYALETMMLYISRL